MGEIICHVGLHSSLVCWYWFCIMIINKCSKNNHVSCEISNDLFTVFRTHIAPNVLVFLLIQCMYFYKIHVHTHSPHYTTNGFTYVKSLNVGYFWASVWNKYDEYVFNNERRIVSLLTISQLLFAKFKTNTKSNRSTNLCTEWPIHWNGDFFLKLTKLIVVQKFKKKILPRAFVLIIRFW